jgi:hypothetical protein
MIKYEEFNELVNLEIDASNYEDHGNFADDYLVTSCLSKSANLPLGIDVHKVALDSFYESERICKETNDRLGHMLPPVASDASRWIARVLGTLTEKDLDFVSNHFRFGPGATTGVKGHGCVQSDKYDAEMHLTPELYPFYRTILGDRWWEHLRKPVIVDGSKFTTVPKNAKTDRGIAIEPTLNIYVQLGIGALIRKRLAYFGLDLNTQENNRYLASIAYTEGLATIDLSMASDLISWKTVMSLLPPRWFDLLLLAKSDFMSVEGVSVELEKFSSMGNGFTFELETLIFASVVRSVVPKKLHHLTSVYGDDIIVPQTYANDVIESLKFLGFKVNLKKSFLAGSFFESCGSDWFKNHSVRPFYLRQQKGSKIPYVVQIANNLRNYANMRNNGYGCDSRFRPLWVSLFKAAPSEWRSCKVPSEFGDLGFIVSRREARPRVLRNSIEGFSVRIMLMKPKSRSKGSFGVLLAALSRAVLDIPTYGREPRRGYLGKHRPKWTTVSQWSEEFEWI